MKLHKHVYDIAVIGGGLAGLTAAVFLARKGKSVILLEKEAELGGLSQTTEINGTKFNFGPRAMYEGGAALQILKELDCLPKGGYASKKGMIGILGGKLVQVPSDLTVEENEEWSQLMGGLKHIDTNLIMSISVQEWAEANIREERARLFFYAMCRQWCYCDDLSALSSGFAIKQGQLAGLGVRYVDRGWQTVVDQLHSEAEKAGVTIVRGGRAEQIMVQDGAVRGVQLAGGQVIGASFIISAIGPNEVCQLVDGADQLSLGKWRDECRPLYAACLDVGLKTPSYPERIFALGLDRPLYYSNHSVSVNLSDHGVQVFHLMKYINKREQQDPELDKKELLELLHLLQPGWDSEMMAMRFLPELLVAHDLRSVRHQGRGPAPSPVVPELRGLYVAGDWVGQGGRMADAAMASAKMAALEILRHA